MKKIKILLLMLIISIVPSLGAVDVRKAANVRMSIDEKATIDERAPIDVRYGVDSNIYERQIYQRFGSFVDDVYTISIKAESEINSQIIIDGVVFDLTPFLIDVAIGSAVIITLISMPALIPAGIMANQGVVAMFVTKVAAGVTSKMIEVAAGTAISAGISSIKTYVDTGGNLEKTQYSALLGAGKGFKWSAILVSAKSLINGIVKVNEVPSFIARHSHNPTVNYVKQYVTAANGKQAFISMPVFKSANGTPIFELPKELLLGSRAKHFTNVTNQLAKWLESNPNSKRLFTDLQLEQITSGAPKIDGLTWHHMGQKGKLMLVDESIHQSNAHIGGFAIWGADFDPTNMKWL